MPIDTGASEAVPLLTPSTSSDLLLRYGEVCSNK
jgi:hypothetical protein